MAGQSGGNGRAALARRFAAGAAGAEYDAVFLQREGSLIGPAWSERLLRARQPAIVYDFDDAVYLPYVSPTNRYLSYLKFPWKTRALCRMAGGRHRRKRPPRGVCESLQ